MLRDPRLLILLAAGSLTTMAGAVVTPVLPEVIQQLNLDPVLAGNLVSMHCLTIALFSPVLGIVADRYSRLAVLIPALVCYAIFGVAGALMQNFWPLLLTRALLGAATGGIAAASLGLLSNLYEEPQRTQAIGYATGALTVTGIIYPLLGGWLGSAGWQNAFYLYAIGIILAIFAKGILPETQHSGKTKTLDGQKLAQVLKHSHTLWLLLTVSLMSATMYGFRIYLPLYLKANFQTGPVVNGIVLASTAIGVAAVSALGVSRLTRKWSLEQVIALGCGLMAAMMAGIPQLNHLNLIVPAAIVCGMGFGLILPSLYAALAQLSPAQMRSSVLAAGTGAGFLGQFLAPIIIGPILGWGGLIAVFYGAAIISILTGLWVFIRSRSA